MLTFICPALESLFRQFCTFTNVEFTVCKLQCTHAAFTPVFLRNRFLVATCLAFRSTRSLHSLLLVISLTVYRPRSRLRDVVFSANVFSSLATRLPKWFKSCSMRRVGVAFVFFSRETTVVLVAFNRLSSRSAMWGFLQTHSLMIQTVGFNPDFSLAQLCRHVSQRVAYPLLGF